MSINGTLNSYIKDQVIPNINQWIADFVFKLCDISRCFCKVMKDVLNKKIVMMPTNCAEFKAINALNIAFVYN